MTCDNRYLVEDCGCIRYNGSEDSRIIVWCGTLARDVAALRLALDRAEATAERADRLNRIAAVYPEAAAEARKAGIA
jgi:hypothetical protein